MIIYNKCKLKKKSKYINKIYFLNSPYNIKHVHIYNIHHRKDDDDDDDEEEEKKNVLLQLYTFTGVRTCAMASIYVHSARSRECMFIFFAFNRKSR